MSESIVLRFRDLVAKTIQEHSKIIQKKQSVWWGWWNKPDERIPRTTFSNYKSDLKQGKTIEVFLVDSGSKNLYKAELVDLKFSEVEDTIECPDVKKTPRYYKSSQYKAWFCFRSIQEVDKNEITKWSYDETEECVDDQDSDKYKNKRIYDLEEMLNRSHRTIYFINAYDKKKHNDAPNPVKLEPAAAPKNFTIHPVLANSNYFLHLSDLHFGEKSHAYPLGPKPGKQKLSTMIAQNLKKMYGPDTQPASVIITGDLTWQGTSEEYKQAYDFLQDIISVFNLKPQNFLIMPGNHDIQWAHQNKNEYDRTKPIENPPEQAKQNYIDFYQKMFGTLPNEDLSVGRRYILANFTSVDIIGLNSSKLEQKHFAGYGYISWEQFTNAVTAMAWSSTKNRTKYRILALHHHIMPVNSKEEIDTYDRIYSLTLDAGQILYGALEQQVSLIVHGHMHQPFSATVSRNIKGCDKISPRRVLAIHGSGSASVSREHLGPIGKHSYSLYEFDEKEIRVKICSQSENYDGFQEDWGYKLLPGPDEGLVYEGQS